MSPRPYRLTRRALSIEETRRRILDATVALHAEKGALATSYAEIAARADVATPTVYKHFPTRRDLLAGCTAHASADAPPCGPEVLAGTTTTEQRLRAVLSALYAQYAHLQPWLRWHEEPRDPDLAAVLAPARAAVAELFRAALVDATPSRQALALLEALAAYPAWETLVHRHGFTNEEAVDISASALLRLLTRAEERLR